jgi:predicted secreted protein
VLKRDFGVLEHRQKGVRKNLQLVEKQRHIWNGELSAYLFQWVREFMNSKLYFQTGFCTEYEALLHRCDDARQSCANWRDQMNAAPAIHSIDKEVADELLRLQARYAKAYARLEEHYKHCTRCQFVAKGSEQECELVGQATGTDQSRSH